MKNPCFPDFIPLTGTVTYDMQTGEASREYPEPVVAKGSPEQVKS